MDAWHGGSGSVSSNGAGSCNVTPPSVECCMRRRCSNEKSRMFTSNAPLGCTASVHSFVSLTATPPMAHVSPPSSENIRCDA
eukprot:5569247-Prymnesium_polylepis.1